MYVLVLTSIGCSFGPSERHRSCQRWERNNARSEHPVTVCDPTHKAWVETSDGESTQWVPPGQQVQVVAYVRNQDATPLETIACATRTEIRGSTSTARRAQACGEGPVTIPPGERVLASATPFTAGEFGEGTTIAIVDFERPEPCSTCAEVTVRQPENWTCARYWREHPPDPSHARPCPEDGDVGYLAHLVDAEGAPIDGTARGQGAEVHAWIENRGVAPLALTGCEATEFELYAPLGGGSGAGACARQEREVAPGEHVLARRFAIDPYVRGTGGTVLVVRFSGPTSCAVCTEWTMTE
jgi:hypothetical protein